MLPRAATNRPATVAITRRKGPQCPDPAPRVDSSGFQEANTVADPFLPKPAGGTLARLLGSRRALAEIETVLAGAARLSEIAPGSIEQIAKQHGLDLDRRLAAPRRSLYRRFLEHCLVDCALSAEENADLAHLQRLLRLSDADAAGVHDEVAQAVYGRAVAEVLRDQQLDPEERSFLTRIGANLELPPAVAAEIYEKGAQQSRERYLARARTGQSALVAPRATTLELPGSSEQSLEDAIRAALAEASRALPSLASARLREIRTDVREGRVVRWHVVMETEVERTT
jgi:flavin-binding protein dodecin